MTVTLDEASVSTWNRRWGVRLADGALVEAVLYRDDTLCVSSQVGCAVRCPFCASGANGLGRSLSFDELVGQVAAVRALGHVVRRVTVSGVGEPLHNADAVSRFVSEARTLGAPASLTTSGGPIARLREALEWPHNGLTISVHAGTEPMRAELVPHAPSLDALFGTLREAVPALSARRRKKTALAYLLLDGRNDADAEIDAFVSRVLPLDLSIHLYAYNPVPTSHHVRAARLRYESVYARMRSLGLVVRMSSQARIEANGGCGTLVARRTSPTR